MQITLYSILKPELFNTPKPSNVHANKIKCAFFFSTSVHVLIKIFLISKLARKLYLLTEKGRGSLIWFFFFDPVWNVWSGHLPQNSEDTSHFPYGPDFIPYHFFSGCHCTICNSKHTLINRPSQAQQHTQTYLRTVKTRAILPMARILLRITSFLEAIEPPGKSWQSIIYIMFSNRKVHLHVGWNIIKHNTFFLAKRVKY